MAETKTILRPTATPNVFADVNGGMEPLFARSVERGEVQYHHQSGYGCLPESRVTVVGVRGTYKGEAE